MSKMKELALAILAIVSMEAYAQARVEFGYDTAGNRVYRRVIVLDSQLRRSVRETDDWNQEKFEQNALPELETGAAVLAVGRDVQIYPNPTRGRLMVHVSGSVSEGHAMVYDLKGSLLTKLAVSEGLNPIELSSYSNGRYVLVLILDSERREYVVVKK